MSKKAMNEMINGLRSECQSLEAANELLRAKIIELTAAYSKELDELAQRNYQLRVNADHAKADVVETAYYEGFNRGIMQKSRNSDDIERNARFHSKRYANHIRQRSE